MTHHPVLSYTVEHHPEPTTQLVVLRGKLVGSPEAYRLLEETRDRIQEGQTRVCLVMDDVGMINSSGAGVIAAMYMSARRQDGRLILAGVQERGRKVLEFMHLNDFVEIVDTVGDAADA